MADAWPRVVTNPKGGTQAHDSEPFGTWFSTRATLASRFAQTTGFGTTWERLAEAPTIPPIWKRVKSSMELGKGAKRLLES